MQSDAEFRDALVAALRRGIRQAIDSGLILSDEEIVETLLVPEALPLINARVAEARLEEHRTPPCRDCDNRTTIGGDWPECERGKQLESELAAAQKKLEGQ